MMTIMMFICLLLFTYSYISTQKNNEFMLMKKIKQKGLKHTHTFSVINDYVDIRWNEPYKYTEKLVIYEL